MGIVADPVNVYVFSPDSLHHILDVSALPLPDARLATIAKLISSTAWASPLHPRPGSLGGTTRSAVCSMAGVKAVSTSSTLLPLGGNARGGLRSLSLLPGADGIICQPSPVDRQRSLCLPHRSAATEATKRFHMWCDSVGSEMGKHGGWGCTVTFRERFLSRCLVRMYPTRVGILQCKQLFVP